MRTNILYFFSIIIFFILFGCKKDEAVNPPEEKGNIQPLTVGNEWHYVDSTFIDSLAIVDTTINIKITAKQFMEKIADGKEVYSWDVFRDSVLLRENFVRLEDDGLWHYGEVNNSDTLNAAKMWGKYPVYIGDTFNEKRYVYDSVSHSYSEDDVWKWTCTELYKPIRMKSGRTIYCIVFSTENKNGEEIQLLYSVNIGYAGWITKKNNKIIFRETLTSYNLN